MTATSSPSSTAPCLIERIAAMMERFVFLKESSLYTLIATWIVGTYLHKHFDYYGYLQVTSPEFQCGKTRTLDVIGLLVFKPSDVIINPTEAVIFHSAHDHTQILDEIDTWHRDHNFQAILNAGFQYTGAVQRMWKGKDGNYDTVMPFPVYGPKVLAGIGQVLSRPTQSRVFKINMVRQTRSEKRARFRREDRALFAPLKAEIEQWAKENSEAVQKIYETRLFPYLEMFNDRTIDIADSLAAIVEVACPGNEVIRKKLVDGISISRDEKEATQGVSLFSVLANLTKDGPLVKSPTELETLVKPFVPEMDHIAISEQLKKYGLESKNIRQGDSVRHRYTLDHAFVSEVLERFGVGGGVADVAPPTLDPEDVLFV